MIYFALHLTYGGENCHYDKNPVSYFHRRRGQSRDTTSFYLRLATQTSSSARTVTLTRLYTIAFMPADADSAMHESLRIASHPSAITGGPVAALRTSPCTAYLHILRPLDRTSQKPSSASVPASPRTFRDSLQLSRMRTLFVTEFFPTSGSVRLSDTNSIIKVAYPAFSVKAHFVLCPFCCRPLIQALRSLSVPFQALRSLSVSVTGPSLFIRSVFRQSRPVRDMVRGVTRSCFAHP